MSKNLGKAPLKIGGWLILVVLRLFGTAFGIVSFLSQYSGNTVPYSIYTECMPFEAFALMLTIVCLIMFFIRHKSFIKLYIGLEVSGIILVLIIASNSSNAGATLAAIAANIGWAVVWILYMVLSQRVKKTFVYSAFKQLDVKLVNSLNAHSSKIIESESEKNIELLSTPHQTDWPLTQTDMSPKEKEATNEINTNTEIKNVAHMPQAQEEPDIKPPKPARSKFTLSVSKRLLFWLLGVAVVVAVLVVGGLLLYDSAYKSGLAEGKEDGYAEGYNKGYNRGYDSYKNSQDAKAQEIELLFFRNHACIATDEDKYYHLFNGCYLITQYIDEGKGFYIFNIEQAEAYGYKSCPLCYSKNP